MHRSTHTNVAWPLKTNKLIYKDSSLGRVIRTSAPVPRYVDQMSSLQAASVKEASLETTHSIVLVLTSSLWGTVVTSLSWWSRELGGPGGGGSDVLSDALLFQIFGQFATRSRSTGAPSPTTN